MLVSSRLALRLSAFALAVATSAFVLAGCSQAGTQSITVMPLLGAPYHQFQTYPDVPVLPNVQYDTVGGKAVRLDVCLPPVTKGAAITPRPAILAIHGGSWALGDKSGVQWRSICQWLAKSGYVAASVDYGLAPKYVYPTAINEIEHAVEWMRSPAQVKRFSIDPTLIGVFGGSAGGNLAALVGTTGSGPLDTGHRVAAVVDLSGPINLTATGAEHADLIPYQLSYLHCRTLANCPAARDASPLFHVDPSDPPFFIGHSLSERIPLTQSSSFVARLRASGVAVTFVTVEGDLHSIDMLDDAMRRRIAAFLHATLVHTLIGAVK
jgi:acetyl esterase/lipase